MNTVNVAKVVQERLPYIDMDATVVSQAIKETSVKVGLYIYGGVYEYTVSAENVERKIKINIIDYDVIEKLETFFEDLRARIFNDYAQPGQMSMFSDDEVINGEVPKKIEVVSGPDDEAPATYGIDDPEFAEQIADEMTEDIIDVEFSENSSDVSIEFSENDRETTPTDNEMENIEETLVEDVNSSEIALNDETDIKEEIDNLHENSNPLQKACERCGEVTMDLDINNECASCAAAIDAGQVITNESNGFGETITASF